jgi:hypothetical protein
MHVSSFMYILEIFISILVKILIRIQSNANIAPPFVHCKFWRCTKSGDKSKYYPIGNFFHRLSTTLRGGGAISGKGKSVPLQARRDPEGSGSSGSQITRQRPRMVVRLSVLRTGRFSPQEILLVLISVRGWVDPRAVIGRILCYWKNHWHQLGSNQRPSDF